MNILKKGALALTALGIAGTGVGVGLATAASASPPQTFSATAQLVSNVAIAPGIVEHNWNLYQPSVLAPGFKLAATESQICISGPRGGTACTFRLTTVGPPALSNQLIGTEVFAAANTGEVGAITGGTNHWRGARGIVRTSNLVPNVQNASFVFSTP